MEPRETVGDRVRRYRRARRWTQEQLADSADVDRRYLGRIETGAVQEPGSETVRKLARALEVPLRTLAEPLGWYESSDTGTEGFDTWEQVERAIMDSPNLDEAQKNGLILVLKPVVTAQLEQAVKPPRRKGRAAS